MCTVSMIYDMSQKTWPFPPENPLPSPTRWVPGMPSVPTWTPPTPEYNGPTKEQFQELIELLRAAKKFDIATGQPDCEDKMKKEMLRKMAQAIGIDLPADL